MISALEEFDETPEGEFFELISMGMAELYSKKLAREAAAGKIANAKLGKVHGGTPLLGYKVKNKYYVIDEKEAQAVRIIFEMTVQGYGYTIIRDYLNAQGYRHSDGRLFTAHFYDILRNRKYIGEYVYNRTICRDEFGRRNHHKQREPKDIIRIPHGMPQIIDEDTFYKVQNILDSRGLRGTPKKADNRKYLLSGLLRCKECGRSICGAYAITEDLRYPVYRCGAKGRTCPTRVINAEYLEKYLLSLFYDCLLLPQNEDRLKQLVQTCYTKAFRSLQQERQTLLHQMREAEKFIHDYSDKLSADDSKQISEFMSGEIENLAVQVRDLQDKYRFVTNEISAFPEFKPNVIKRNAKKFADMLKDEQFSSVQQAFNKLIHRIEIDNDWVETSINFNVLLDSHYPIVATVIEKRDYIARPENHFKRSLVFSTLTVRL